MSEKKIDVAMEQEPPHPAYVTEPGFKVSSFEQRLIQEIDFREGKVAPQHHEPNNQAFTSVLDSKAPVFEQKLRNFQLMEGSDATFVCKVTAAPLPHVSTLISCKDLLDPAKYQLLLFVSFVFNR